MLAADCYSNLLIAHGGAILITIFSWLAFDSHPLKQMLVVSNSFILPDSFEVIDFKCNDPISMETFTDPTVSFCYSITDSAFQAGSETTWELVKTLDIVRDFAQGNYLIGFLLYPIDNSLKWFVFLYQNRE